MRAREVGRLWEFEEELKRSWPLSGDRTGLTETERNVQKSEIASLLQK